MWSPRTGLVRFRKSGLDPTPKFDEPLGPLTISSTDEESGFQGGYMRHTFALVALPVRSFLSCEKYLPRGIRQIIIAPQPADC